MDSRDHVVGEHNIVYTKAALPPLAYTSSRGEGTKGEAKERTRLNEQN